MVGLHSDAPHEETETHCHQADHRSPPPLTMPPIPSTTHKQPTKPSITRQNSLIQAKPRNIIANLNPHPNPTNKPSNGNQSILANQRSSYPSHSHWPYLQSHLLSLNQFENGDVAFCFHHTTYEANASLSLLDFPNLGICLTVAKLMHIFCIYLFTSRRLQCITNIFFIQIYF